MIAKGVQGAVTGSEDVRVMHILYADDLPLLAHTFDAMQTMLNRLVVYARSKHLTITDFTFSDMLVDECARHGSCLLSPKTCDWQLCG